MSADQVLQQFRVLRPPIHVELLARNMGIDIDVCKGGALGGAPCLVKGKTITVEESSRWRMRFAIAHGMAHVIREESVTCNSEFLGNAGDAEWAANEFALDLLMPMWMVERYAMALVADPNRRWWQFWKLDVNGLLTRMASVFDVSVGAMNLRLSKL